MTRRQTLDEHFAADHAQLEQRHQIGDAAATARELEHFAYFTRRSRAQEAAAALVEAGFRVEVRRSGFKTAVIARHDSDVLPDTVERNTRTLFDIIESRGGNYDGWGGMIAV
ncbi:MAG: ribonuclease E inhibitor RraB [Microbacteriaceae bacterium]